MTTSKNGRPPATQDADDFTEKRLYPRVKVDIVVPWGWEDDCPYSDRMTSFSAGGCFLQTNKVRRMKDAPRGKPIFIRFWLPDERILPGEVRYCLENVGVGIEFKGLSDEERGGLIELAEAYARTHREGGKPGPAA